MYNYNAKFYVTVAKVNKKSIEKILRNDTQILSKLNTIITNQKQLDNRILKIEEALDKTNNNNADTMDPNDLKVIEIYGYYIQYL